MKKFISLSIVATLLASVSYSQTVAINNDGSPANANAILDIKSTTKGVLVPRMTTAQRIAIPFGSPNGLLVFDTDDNSFWYFISPTWRQITPAVGFTATPSVAKTIASGTYSPLTPYTELSDDGNVFNPTNGAFTAPSSGLYHFEGLVQWLVPISGSPEDHVPSSIRIYRNGEIVPGGQVTRILDIENGYGNGLSVSVDVKLAIGDVVIMGVFYVSATNTFVAAGGGASGGCYFSGRKVY